MPDKLNVLVETFSCLPYFDDEGSEGKSQAGLVAIYTKLYYEASKNKWKHGENEGIEAIYSVFDDTELFDFYVNLPPLPYSGNLMPA